MRFDWFIVAILLLHITLTLLCCVQAANVALICHFSISSTTWPANSSVQYTGGCSVHREDIIEYTGVSIQIQLFSQ